MTATTAAGLRLCRAALAAEGGEMRMGTDEPMRSEEYAEGYAAGVASLRMIRCVEHREVPPFNASEIGGGECTACAVKAAQEHSLVLQTEANALRARVAEMEAWAAQAEAVRVAAMRVVDFDLSDWKTRLDLLETAARACPPLESVTACRHGEGR